MDFCFSGDKLNTSSGCEAAVTERDGFGWIRFRECGVFVLGNSFPLRMKAKVRRCCV